MKNFIKLLLLLMVMMTTLSTQSMAQKKDVNVLVLIYSDNGGTLELAKEFAKGLEKNSNVRSVIKQVKHSDNPILKTIPVISMEELSSYDGIAFGSPVYFGNISTGMSEFFSKTTDLWAKHALEGMPASVFMSAGTGAGRELALQSFWNTLAVHGMILVSNGIRSNDKIDRSIAQGNSVLGTTSLVSIKNVPRPSSDERLLAEDQGENFGKVAKALQGTFHKESASIEQKNNNDINQELINKNIILPDVPKPAGNYQPFVRTGNLIFINQYALKDGKLQYPGKLGKDVDEKQVKEATRTTMLNVLGVLKDAVGGDLNRIKKCVQLTGYFNVTDDYTKHADLMNAASDLVVEVFGEKGKHARATVGASSLPGNTSVEIQAIFEIE
ncbi:MULTISPECIES: Atu1372/SO_1960 family protein [unclassified Sphingobacterium]|uniref:Atu1372/SO_1960 family protein n=1 Tax=unclassified Sphingobacterium TaxID=2609468 RepID=UPI0025DD6636|nr:Atu1372/SO_1960 family protein [Sphingobacterium sp. UBA5670]